jgi:CheY-like chemotaxis protein
MGGAIEMVTELGRGTSVVLKLQVWKGDAQDSPAGGEAQPTSLNVARGFNILAVDDNTTALDNLRQVLEHLEARVVAVDTGGQACQLLATAKFDLVFTDLGMPEVNGWGVAQAASSQPSPPRVVLCTGWGESISQAEAASKGCWRVLAKPYTLEQVEEIIAEFARSSRPRREAA